MSNAAAAVRPDILVLCHGGPIATPEDAQYIFDHTEGTAGFFGASSVERLAVEPAIEGQARAFKALKL
jgi:predicted TIM-barrel enzyme